MPLELQCAGCGAEFEAELSETTIHVYQEREFNHVHTFCLMCKAPFFLFFDDMRFLMLGYKAEYHEEVDENIIAIRAQLEDPPQELHDDPEAIMDAVIEHNFHDWLEEVTPDDFK